jgi:hypothetical protein
MYLYIYLICKYLLEFIAYLFWFHSLYSFCLSLEEGNELELEQLDLQTSQLLL